MSKEGVGPNDEKGRCAPCGHDVPVGAGWSGSYESPSDHVYCGAHREDARLDRVWNAAFDRVCGTDSDAAVAFFKPAWEEFQALLAGGEVSECDRDLFMASWSEHNWLFVQANDDLMDDHGEEVGSHE